jgi:pentatricopeptide repeat protein
MLTLLVSSNLCNPKWLKHENPLISNPQSKMKLTRPHRPLTNSTIYPKQRNLCTSKFTSQDNDENDSNFVSILGDIVRGNQSWKVALNNTYISSTLRPYHVEKVLIQTLDDSRLALRFFNFLGLHQKFNHSPTSFCILIHALIQSNLFWPASSLLQTLFLRGLDPKEVFEHFLNSYKKFNFASSLGFDLLIQNYVQNKRLSDGVLVVNLMKENKLLPEVRTRNALLNGRASEN